jgi:3-oxoacyl-(acyl-carrier-protein) synthase
MTPRAITGLGIACALGVGAESFFRAMKEGPVPLSRRPTPAPPIASFDATKYEGRTLPVVEVPGFDPTKYLGDKGLRTLDRLTKLLVVAARLCLHDAGFKKDNQWVVSSPERVGVVCSNAYGSLEAITELDRVAQLEDARYINPAKFPNTVSNSASGYVSIWEDLRALNVSVSDGNCGGLDAVACADIFLTTERAQALLTGGGEAMSEPLFLAFERLGALGETRIGEGAVFLALETLEAARARGARVLGTIIGYATSFVAPQEDSTLIFASREALERATTQALADAGVEAKDVDVVASGVSGLTAFDAEELAALEAAVPGKPVAAPKLLLGETLGAGGAMGMAAALAWLDGAPVSALVRGDAPAKVDTVLVTAVGYYGNASAVVLRRA